MTLRIDHAKAAPGAARALMGLEQYVRGASLDAGLLHLVKIRASQINGCAHCLDMHTKEARADGETEQRLYVLPAWREAPFYTDRERAALAWTEAVTLIGHGAVSDDVYATARRQFSERELVDLTMAVIAINGWNRLNVAFQSELGNSRGDARTLRAVATAP